MRNFTQKVAIRTGGNSGIGYGAAKILKEQVADVVANKMANYSLFGAISFHTRLLATALSPRDIKVNTISPDATETTFYATLGIPAEEVAVMGEILRQNIMLHRFSQPEEIAKVVSLLASVNASFRKGTEVVIDGSSMIYPVTP